MDSVLYYAPTYFSPFYFTPLDPSALEGLTPAPYRDRDAFEAIVAALSATGEFADVLTGAFNNQNDIGADRSPVAVILPEEWVEHDDVDPSFIVRQVSYTLILQVRLEDPAQRFDSLDRLSSLVLNTLDGSDLGGGCLPALTRIRRGNYDSSSRYPEQRLVLFGEFAY